MKQLSVAILIVSILVAAGYVFEHQNKLSEPVLTDQQQLEQAETKLRLHLLEEAEQAYVFLIRNDPTRAQVCQAALTVVEASAAARDTVRYRQWRNVARDDCKGL